MYLNLNNLNATEVAIHEKLPDVVKLNPDTSINHAAELCGVSISKISKYVKKLDFANFKQYKLFFSGATVSIDESESTNELKKIKKYVENFDWSLIDKFLEEFNKYDKIILFGLGPSFICMEYFAYKLNFVSDKKIFTTQEESRAKHLADDNTLVFIFSVTGAFLTFEAFAHKLKQKEARVILVLEEFNSTATKEIDNIFYLTKSIQNGNLKPYEKTRTIFFIFIEEVISKLMDKNI